MEEILERLYDMTAFSNIAADPRFLIMYAIAFVLLYLGIKKQYEPLLLVPIAFGVLLANFPGGDMGVVQADENGMVMVNGVMKNIWEMPLHEIAHFNNLVRERESWYDHTLEGWDDMPAHAKSSLVGASLSIPITDGRLNLGTWQGIYLCEFRNHGGGRRIVATILGE